MEFKEIKKFDEFFKEFKEVIYPQRTEEAEKTMKNQKSAKNIDGSVSKAANEVLKYGLDIKNGRNVKDIVEEMYQNHKKDSVVEEDYFRFTLFAVAYFLPKGVEIFNTYNDRAGIKINPLLQEKIDVIEARTKIFDAELELERVKQEVHEASKRD